MNRVRVGYVSGRNAARLSPGGSRGCRSDALARLRAAGMQTSPPKPRKRVTPAISPAPISESWPTLPVSCDSERYWLRGEGLEGSPRRKRERSGARGRGIGGYDG